MSHSYYCQLSHVVFTVKDRFPLLSDSIRERLFPYIGGIVRDQESVLLKAGGTADHVHLLLSFPPKIALVPLVRAVKACSSKWIHELFPEKRGFAWQEGYGAFSVSFSNAEKVKRYIENQEEHHRKQTAGEEFIALLKKHGVPFDERYLWK